MSSIEIIGATSGSVSVVPTTSTINSIIVEPNKTNLSIVPLNTNSIIELVSVPSEKTIEIVSNPGPQGIQGIQGEPGEGIPPGGTTGQILAKTNEVDYNTEWIDNYTSDVRQWVKNDGTTLTKGTPVYVSNANGTNMIVSPASNTTELTSSKTLGLLAQNLAINESGWVITEGLLDGLNTSAAAAGDAVWLGPNGTLIYGLLNKPIAPAHLVFIGIVTRVQSQNGEIFIKPQNGFEVEELHNLLVTAKQDNDVIAYDSATSLWKNKSISTLGLATTSYVNNAVSGLIDSAPATLDTLNELAAALNDDANFATNVVNSIATKASLSGADFSGNVTAPNIVPTYIQSTQPSGTSKYIWWDTSGGNLSLWIEDGVY